jgi:hypothetical protein
MKTNIDATFVRDRLNFVHHKCDKYNIKMDVELKLLHSAVDVLSPVGFLDTSGSPVS